MRPLLPLLALTLASSALAVVTPRDATNTLASRVGAVRTPSEVCRQVEKGVAASTFPTDPKHILKYIEGQRYRLDLNANLNRSLVDLHLSTLGFTLHEPWEQLDGAAGYQAFVLTPETPGYIYLLQLVDVPGATGFDLGHTDMCLIVLGIRR